MWGVGWGGGGPCCFTSTEARLLIRDGAGGGERVREWT